MTRSIDELNNLRRSVDPRKYFEEMGFTEEEIEERIEFTEKANSIFDLILVFILLSADREAIYPDMVDRLESEYLSLINEYAEPDDYLIQYAMDFSENFVGATKDHIDEEWYTSADRSLFNAENSANDVLNYDEYKKAIAEGKTK